VVGGQSSTVHVYCDESGSCYDSSGALYTVPQITGIDASTIYVDDTGSDSTTDKMQSDGVDALTKARETDSLKFDLALDNPDLGEMWLGDHVYTFDHDSGMTVDAEITEVIVKFADGIKTFTYNTTDTRS
jgi:hypothetical protein